MQDVPVFRQEGQSVVPVKGCRRDWWVDWGAFRMGFMVRGWPFEWFRQGIGGTLWNGNLYMS